MKKRSLIFAFIMLVSLGNLASVFAQSNKYSTFYYQRNTLFEKLPINKKDIIFLGNSITNGAEWAELFNNKHVKNRGISGDICAGVYDRLDYLTKGQPKKIFLLIGINDVNRGSSAEEITEGIEKIVLKIKQDSPRTRVYVQSLLPMNKTLGMFQSHTSKGDVVLKINELLLSKTESWGAEFINLYPHFVDSETGLMNIKYTNDGLHLLGEGYLLWVRLMKKYI